MRVFLMILFFFSSIFANAQIEVKGMVVDSATQEKLPAVSVTLLRGGKPLKFTRTDASGKFFINIASLQEDDELQATSMGYHKIRQAVIIGKENIIKMSESAFSLKEVQVKGSRIFGLQDTVTYDLTRFANERDNSLKDVLKKLPGVDVDTKSGKITYNGKSINRFTVEGLDLTGGRYNQLEDNIKAKDVKKAEIIEHDQPIKALRNKVFTDNVAMNIGLKDEARDKLLPTLSPYLLIGDPTHVGGMATVLQMGKMKQRMYEANYDRTGKDLSQDLNKLGTYSDRLEAAELPIWLSIPSLQTPIDDERLRFNTSQKYSIDEIGKGKNDAEWRFNGFYLHSVIRQHTMNTSLYNLGAEAPITTHQDQQLTLFSDDFNVEMEHKVNTENSYGNEFFQVKSSQGDGQSILSDSLQQRIRVPQVDISGSFYRLFSLKHSQLSWRSIVDYHQSASDLYVNEARTRLNTHLWHTSHTLGWLKKQWYLTQQYTVGIDLQNMDVREDNIKFALLLTPYWQYEKGKFSISITSHIRYEHFCRQQQNFFFLNPNIYLRQKVGNRSEWTFNGNYYEHIGDWHEFGIKSYRMDYRSYYQAESFIPLLKTLSAYLSYDYKRPIQELFFNGSVTGSRNWSNASSDFEIINGNYYTTLTQKRSHFENVNVKAGVSKGFYKVHLKTSLDATCSYVEGEQFSAGHRLGYNAQSYVLKPGIEFTPSLCTLSYEGSLMWNASKVTDKSASSLFGCKQTLSLTTTFKNVDVAYSMVYYHNELQEDKTLNTLLSDVSAVWRLKKIRIMAKLSNVFNKKRYEETQYSGISTLTDTYVLRPRELLFTVQFSF